MRPAYRARIQGRATAWRRIQRKSATVWDMAISLGWGTTFKQIRCCCALLGRRTSDVREWDHLRYSGAQGSPSSAPNTLVKSATLAFGTATARAGIGTGFLRGSFPA